MGKYSHVWSGVYTLFFFTCGKKVFFSLVKKKVFFSQVKKNTAVSGILLLLQLLVLVFFLLQYTVSYSEDFFSRCEDFFPKQLSKTCGSYENLFFFAFDIHSSRKKAISLRRKNACYHCLFFLFLLKENTIS